MNSDRGNRNIVCAVCEREFYGDTCPWCGTPAPPSAVSQDPQPDAPSAWEVYLAGGGASSEASAHPPARTGPRPTMNFPEAIRTCFSKYAVFRGRARRAEYWYWMLLYIPVVVLLSVVLGVAENATDSSYAGYRSAAPEGMNALLIFCALLCLALFLPTLAVSVRRLHDTDRSGKWILANLVGLIPVVGTIASFVLSIVLIVFYATEGTGHANSLAQTRRHARAFESLLAAVGTALLAYPAQRNYSRRRIQGTRPRGHIIAL